MQFGNQGAGRAAGPQLALLHNRQPVAESFRLFHIVGGQHYGGALGAAGGNQLPHGAAGLRVEAGRRLVQDYQFGIVDQRGGQGEPLPLAARQGADAGAGLVGQPHPFQQFARRQADGIETAQQRQDFGQMEIFVVGRGLQLHPDAAFDGFGVLRQFHTEDAEAAGGGRLQPLGHFQGGGFAGAVGPQQPEHLARRHRERNAVHGGKVAEPLDQPLNLQSELHPSIINYESRIINCGLERRWRVETAMRPGAKEKSPPFRKRGLGGFYTYISTYTYTPPGTAANLLLW